ncbi:MAG: hypothetical protein AAB451_00770 [Patescibacteria group bacterium]
MRWVKINGIWVILDLEGPQVINDNAQQIMVALAEKSGLGKEIGERAYARFSGIDDVWGDCHLIPQDPNYSSGHTLKVVLPFFKAMGADSRWLQDFSSKSLRVVPFVKEALTDLRRGCNVWMISTSYEWFVRAYCHKVGFNFSQTNCTRVTGFDEIPISATETAQLLGFMVSIARKPVVDYYKETGDIVPEHQADYDEFTRFIWDKVYNMPVGRLLRTVHPVGQTQKREVMETVCQRFGIPKRRVMYVGDSQTDVQVVEWLKGEGLTMMFNGKGRVFALSDIAYVGEDARMIAWVANHFAKDGREMTLAGIANLYKMSQGKSDSIGDIIATITPANRKILEEQSLQKRKQFRGVAIGELS